MQGNNYNYYCAVLSQCCTQQSRRLRALCRCGSACSGIAPLLPPSRRAVPRICELSGWRGVRPGPPPRPPPPPPPAAATQFPPHHALLCSTLRWSWVQGCPPSTSTLGRAACAPAPPSTCCAPKPWRPCGEEALCLPRPPANALSAAPSRLRARLRACLVSCSARPALPHPAAAPAPPRRSFSLASPHLLGRYMWRLTHDWRYRTWGWHIFQAFEKHCKVGGRAGGRGASGHRVRPSGSLPTLIAPASWLAHAAALAPG